MATNTDPENYHGKAFPFLLLPGELRREIYGYVFSWAPKQTTTRRDGVVYARRISRPRAWLLRHKTFGRRQSHLLVGLGSIRDFLSMMRTCKRKFSHAPPS